MSLLEPLSRSYNTIDIQVSDVSIYTVRANVLDPRASIPPNINRMAIMVLDH